MRAFAFVVFLALALLPKTAWVVRNHADLLAGRWAPYGSDFGWQEEVGPVPTWPFEKANLQDGIARTLAMPFHDRRDFREKWQESKTALADPRLRDAVRPLVLRRSFSALLVKPGKSLNEEQREIAQTLLPLALEGEADDPGNAFYASSAWLLYDLLEEKEKAAAALARAARGTRYDEGVFEEIEAFRKGFEAQYGYRGSIVPLVVGTSILLPHLNALGNGVDRIVQTEPLGSPERRDVARLGLLMVRQSRLLFGSIYGRSLFLQTIGATRGTGNKEFFDAYQAFAKANPTTVDARARQDLERMGEVTKFTSSDLPGSLSAKTPVVGAILLLTAIASLVAAWPGKREVGEAFSERLRRANWAWMGLLPVALFDGREAVTLLFWSFVGLAGTSAWLARRKKARAAVAVGLAALLLGLAQARWGWVLPPAIWLAAVALPPKWRSAAWIAVPFAALGTVVWTLSRNGDLTPLVGFAIMVASLRLAIPARKGLAAVPAVAATLYLLAVVADLRTDAQTAEVYRQIGTEAARFRAEHGIGTDGG